jgi:hypothetical protein
MAASLLQGSASGALGLMRARDLDVLSAAFLIDVVAVLLRALETPHSP